MQVSMNSFFGTEIGLDCKRPMDLKLPLEEDHQRPSCVMLTSVHLCVIIQEASLEHRCKASLRSGKPVGVSIFHVDSTFVAAQL